MLSYIKSATAPINRYIDLRFLIKFVCLFLAFYYINLFFVQLALPGKMHNAFFVQHFNYIGWLTESLTQTANFIAHLFGLNSFVTGNNVLWAKQGGHRVIVLWQCIGLGVFSFWFAFILAQHITVKKKILLGIGGFLAIWFLNCLRIGLLVVALDANLKPWKKSLKFIGNVNHHDIFNFVCYSFILLMIVAYYKISTRKKQAAVSNQR